MVHNIEDDYHVLSHINGYVGFIQKYHTLHNAKELTDGWKSNKHMNVT